MQRKLSQSFDTYAENRRKAFTITEVVVASALLLIAIVPILRALSTAHGSTRLIERKTKSLVLARAKLDEIKARSVFNYAGSFDESDTELDGYYLANVTDTSESDMLRLVTVSVGLDQDASATLSSGEIEVTLSTYIAKRW